MSSLCDLYVAPHAGAWIETVVFLVAPQGPPVAPHAGAWIETIEYKLNEDVVCVAPHAGAWIETVLLNDLSANAVRRAPRGRVD